MTFKDDMLKIKRPASIRAVRLPRRAPFRTTSQGKPIPYYPSPVEWAGEVLYFLLPDRFSDGLDHQRPLFDRSQPPASARPAGFRWDGWAESGAGRWQGGTLKGITSRLDYLAELGITAVWIGPVFKQRRHNNEYHGYAIQDFLEVDPHFGTRRDFVELVMAAHQRGIRVIQDVIFNHSGHNWDYEGGVVDPPYRPWPGHYSKGPWLDGNGGHVDQILDDESGVYPIELQDENVYTRAGKGSLGGEDIDNPHAEFKRTDFDGAFRDFNFDHPATLNDLARCYKYWIALTDIDGMRLDTLKHVSKETARNFCGAIKEFAANLGKTDFFLVGEVGGPDDNAGRYLDALELNLNATLDIGDSRVALTQVAKGLASPSAYFDITGQWDPTLGSHRRSAQRHVKVIDDHDHVFGRKVRFSTDASNPHQVIAALAIQLFTLGIPCIYYGTEQALSGPETDQQIWCPGFGSSDRYLRETLFGAEHPRKSGADGISSGPIGQDVNLPGFGAFGVQGQHFFDSDFPVYRALQTMLKVRREYPALYFGRQYQRPTRNFNQPFSLPPAGELIVWSRILDEEEIACLVNSHGTEWRGADVIVDRSLNTAPGSAYKVIFNSAQVVAGAAYTGTHPTGEILPVLSDGTQTYLQIRDVAPSAVLIMVKM